MRDLTTAEVESAGLAAWNGQKASGHTLEVARSWGVDLSGHRARGLSTRLLRRADLIVTMTEEQTAAVRAHFGLPEGKVVPLGYFDESSSSHEETVQQRLTDLLGTVENDEDPWHGPVHIADPYGGSLEAYESCAQQIRRAVIGLRRALREGEIVL
jgi:protein-tyrosine phosphatase